MSASSFRTRYASTYVELTTGLAPRATACVNRGSRVHVDEREVLVGNGGRAMKVNP